MSLKYEPASVTTPSRFSAFTENVCRGRNLFAGDLHGALPLGREVLGAANEDHRAVFRRVEHLRKEWRE